MFEPRFDYAINRGRFFAKDLTILDIPVNPLYLVNDFYDIDLVYDDLRGEEGYTLHNPKTNKFRIFIDNRFYNRRCNFTVAHEIGHIALGHYHDFDVNNLSNVELNILDKEADSFAGEILMPYHIIRQLKTRNIEGLANTLGVSYKAMETRLSILNILYLYDSLSDNALFI